MNSDLKLKKPPKSTRPTGQIQSMEGLTSAVLPKGINFQKKQVEMMKERKLSTTDIGDEVVLSSMSIQRPDSARSRKDLHIKVNNSKNEKQRLLNEKRESASRMSERESVTKNTETVQDTKFSSLNFVVPGSARDSLKIEDDDKEE